MMRLMMVLILLIGGCATINLQMPPGDIGQLDSDEGIVVGSVRVLSPGYDHFHFQVGKKHFDFFRNPVATLSLDPPFGEQVFVTKLPADMYRFARWSAGITDDECDVLWGEAALDFTVRPGKVVYIGSWTLQMPPAGEDPQQSGTEASYSYSIEVEDRREEVLASAATTHGSLIAAASTELMTPSAQRIFRAGVEDTCEGGGGGGDGDGTSGC